MNRELEVLDAAERRTRAELRGAVRRVPQRLFAGIEVRQTIRRHSWLSVMLASTAGFAAGRAIRSSQVRDSVGRAMRAAARRAPNLAQLRSVVHLLQAL